MSDNWRALLGTSTPCACGQTHTVPTREVLIGPGVLDALPQVLERNVPEGAGFIVADETTWQVAGERVAASIGSRSAAPILLAPHTPGHPVKADEHAIDQLLRAVPPTATWLIAIGSGTVNDVTKLVASEREVPSVCVATAPSMNGYPSAIAAISRGGVKLTEPCTPPIAILCDTDIVSRAPARMVQAGLGDLLSKTTSSTDWLIAHLLLGEHFCEEPVRIVEQAEASCMQQAAAIGRQEPQAIDLLMTALIQSGMSMAMAGSSSPASGGEHLISHYWDMTAGARGRQEDLHGRQVALAARLTGTLYERIVAHTAQGLDMTAVLAARPSPDALREQSLAHFIPLLGAGTSEDVARMLLAKHMAPERLGEALRPLAHDPTGFWAVAGKYLRPVEDIRRAHEAAGVPLRASELGITPAQVREAFLYARHIRSRYTVLDLAADLGLLEAVADEVIQQAGV